MTFLGNIGVTVGRRAETAPFAFGRFSMAVINGTGATPGALVVVFRRTRAVAAAMAGPSGAWQTNGLDDGEYWAVELGTVRGWLVTVAGASVTVVEQDAPGAGDVITAGSAFGWIG